jgi:hypothetical protein
MMVHVSVWKPPHISVVSHFIYRSNDIDIDGNYMYGKITNK